MAESEASFLNLWNIFDSEETDISKLLFILILDVIVTTALVSLVAKILGLFPGHGGGGFYPVYVPEHYGPRNSQYLFDPYSFTHIEHGILAYYLFKCLFNLVGIEVNIGPNLPNVLLIGTLLFELGWEILENSELVINRFRENSGTSEAYEGDSSVNIFGDLLSCGFGYNMSRFMFENLNLPAMPLILLLIIEVSLLITIRDNLILILIQLSSPIEALKMWQLAIIPEEFQSGSGTKKSNEKNKVK